jgi:hypothetical protein
MQQRRLEGRSSAIVFCDLSAAFYTIWTDVFLGMSECTENSIALIAKAGFHPRVVERVRMQGVEGMMSKYSIGKPWQRFLRDWHAMSSFTTKGSQRAIQPWTGARPGDVLADAVFSLAARCFHDDLHENLTEGGLVEKGTFRGRHIFPRTGNEEEE